MQKVTEDESCTKKDLETESLKLELLIEKKNQELHQDINNKIETVRKELYSSIDKIRDELKKYVSEQIKLAEHRIIIKLGGLIVTLFILTNMHIAHINA